MDVAAGLPHLGTLQAVPRDLTDAELFRLCEIAADNRSNELGGLAIALLRRALAPGPLVYGMQA